MSGFDFSDRLELLVEGELSDEQRRDVLVECEQDPLRWKALAVAFLEQQKIRDGMKLVHQDVAIHETMVEPTRSFRSVPWRSTIALAACVMIAFTVGFRSGQPASSDTTVANNVSETDGLVVRAESFEQNNQSIEQIDPKDDGIVGYVQWQGNGGRVRLSPVFVGQVDDQWLKDHPPQIDRKVQQVMSRAGWQVEPARKFVSVNLTSGDQFTIPMDDVEYRYVGRQVY